MKFNIRSQVIEDMSNLPSLFTTSFLIQKQKIKYMTITSKFKINDLVKHKFSTSARDKESLHEVLFINSETCSAGTQIFYNCRPILIVTEMDYIDGKKTPVRYVSDGRNSQNINDMGCVKFREDELISCSQETIDFVLNANK